MYCTLGFFSALNAKRTVLLIGTSARKKHALGNLPRPGLEQIEITIKTLVVQYSSRITLILAQWSKRDTPIRQVGICF